MAKNFGQMLSSLESWAREPVDPDIGRDALNDGIEAIWSKIIEAQVSQFVGGPVNLSLSAATERAQIVSIADPTVQANIWQTPGGVLGPRVVYGTYTLVTESASETLPGPQAQFIVDANNLLQQFSPNFPPSAQGKGLVGWNCYMSTSPDTLGLQNDAPIPFGQSFIEPDFGVVEAPESKAPPVENTTGDDVFYVRNLEVPLSSGGFKSWDQVTIDSQMFKWASRSIASSSEYQPYYYDLVNGRTLEYRPALGTSFPTARYFFIHRPRRIVYDTAAIPFYTFPWEEALRSYALAAWFLTQNEQAAEGWTQKGDAALMRTCTLLRQQDWDKNLKITPFMAGY